VNRALWFSSSHLRSSSVSSNSGEGGVDMTVLGGKNNKNSNINLIFIIF